MYSAGIVGWSIHIYLHYKRDRRCCCAAIPPRDLPALDVTLFSFVLDRLAVWGIWDGVRIPNVLVLCSNAKIGNTDLTENISTV